MAKPNLRLVTPTTEDRTVTPRRAPNTQLRSREHLTADEVEKVIEAIKQNRYGHCDAVMVLLTFRHGLRAAEVVDLRWEQVDFKTASLHIRRTKNGTPATHPLSGREMRELTTRAQSRRTSVTAIFRTRRAIPRSRRSGSRNSFETESTAHRGSRKATPPTFAILVP